MKDLNRNTRTLIICFVIAIFSLIPLRFYEYGNQISEMNRSQILGLSEEVVLPESELIDTSEPVLEYPYNQIEGVVDQSCLSQEEVDMQMEPIIEVLQTEGLDEETVTVLIGEIDRLESELCR